MRNLTALLVLAVASLAGAAEQKYDFTLDQQTAGTATMSYTKLPDSGSQLVIDLNVDFAGQKIHQRQEMRYDKDGKPTLTTTLIEQGDKKSEQKVVFGIVSLTNTTTASGKTTASILRYPLGTSMAEPSQLWFFTTHPETNATSTETVYNMKTGKFDRHKRVYLGPTMIDFNGKKTRTLMTQDSDLADGSIVTQWVDTQGMPYRMVVETGGHSMQFERVKS